MIALPEPARDGTVSVERALRARRSVRSYSSRALSLAEVSQLLWAAQGITDPEGLRAVPSAGALYPLEIYLVAGSVQDLPPGVYRYGPKKHTLIRAVAGDKRRELAAAALDQDHVRAAPAALVVGAEYDRTTVKYRDRGIQYVHIEAGHAAQNICLQAVALNLGSVVVGAFDDVKVKKLLGMPDPIRPLCLVPVGRPVR